MVEPKRARERAPTRGRDTRASARRWIPNLFVLQSAAGRALARRDLKRGSAAESGGGTTATTRRSGTAGGSGADTGHAASTSPAGIAGHLAGHARLRESSPRTKYRQPVAGSSPRDENVNAIACRAYADASRLPWRLSSMSTVAEPPGGRARSRIASGCCLTLRSSQRLRPVRNEGGRARLPKRREQQRPAGAECWT
jgi:hypothetical protein